MKTASFTVHTAPAADGAWLGKITGPGIAEPLLFEDISGMLLKLDAHMDKNKYPRAYQRKRRFSSPVAISTNTQKHPDYTRVFFLYIKSRQNATWQGTLDWGKGNLQTFASELELLRLLQSGL